MKLNLPTFKHKIRHTDGKASIFDVIRKKYVALTPEEWVRQHLVNYLIHQLGYPRSLISVESGLKFNQLNKRTDIVVYNSTASPLMVAECKSFKVALSNDVFQQSAIYNDSLRAPYLLISNGIEHYCCRLNYQASSYEFLNAVPNYGDIAPKKSKAK